ncbi:universal stress protein [Amycolatopsis sp. K13G38]|uniref:Universal stress protein n=1 Tax=Amycolatopsis acididurans TaxID=2724524 RepID=A0ABX1IX32_9PSEU|nr:universal stress protein [Amycolatopsis acididurans]NKQ52047.1 universal stress protein [Amycolatopsis acididurans]
MSDATDAIVVGVDGSEQAARAVGWAAAEASRRNLRLHLVSGLDPLFAAYGGGLPVPQEMYDAMDDYARDKLSEAAAAAHAVDAGLVITQDRQRIPAIPALLDAARVARMVVIGASGHGGFTGMLAGSTAIAVATHAECPVVVVRTRQDGSVPAEGPVIAGVDGSATSERALGSAFDEAAWRGVPLEAVHAWSDADYVTTLPVEYAMIDREPPGDEQERVLAESLAGWQEKYPDVHVDRVVVKDRPRSQLIERTARAQLIVVGSRGRGGFSGLLLGSTSQALIHHAECPVMIVRPERG